MRQLLTWRTLIAITGVSVLLVVGLILVSLGSSDGLNGKSEQPSVRRVEMIASVMRLQSTADFAVVDGVTTGSAVLALDDGRTITIATGTPGELSCADRTAPAACVLLADMLGDGVVWYALVNSDSTTARSLVLPTLVDMVDGGDTGVLENGWHVPLANGVTRTCAGQPRSRHLRAFINSYANTGIRTVLDLDRDEIVEVICTN